MHGYWGAGPPKPPSHFALRAKIVRTCVGGQGPPSPPNLGARVLGGRAPQTPQCGRDVFWGASPPSPPLGRKLFWGAGPPKPPKVAYVCWGAGPPKPPTQKCFAFLHVTCPGGLRPPDPLQNYGGHAWGRGLFLFGRNVSWGAGPPKPPKG